MTDPSDEMSRLLAEVDQVVRAERGDLLHGVILAQTQDGLIVDVGLKRDGFVPRSDLERLPAEESRLKVGDEVAVMVVAPVDREGNLIVSVSQARESGDWLRAQRLMDQDEVFEVVPTGANRGGLIVPFGRLRGFIPASHVGELPRGLDEEGRVSRLRNLVGQKMPVKVIEVDPQRQRLVLSERKAVRQWRQEQKARVIEELKEGEVRKGVVTSVADFGVFVDIGGADGLIHISELSWGTVEDPASVLTIGQQVEAMVIRLDRRSSRIGLSLKRLQPNPWQAGAERLTPGREMEGTVSRHASSGIYVQVEGGLEGLAARPSDGMLPEPGTKVLVRVEQVDPDRERLDLTILGAGQASPDPAGVREGGEEA